MSAKAFWTIACAALTLLLYMLITASSIGWHSWLATALLAWIASPILFYVFAYFFERGPVAEGYRGETALDIFKSVFSWREQAWSFIVGDWLLLPLAFVVATLRWSTSDHQIDLSLWWWWIVSLLVGIAAGFGFHFKLDKPGYTSIGKAASLNSPTKLLHDFVSYPVLFGGLLFAVGPMLFDMHWDFAYDWHVYAILALVAVWLVLGVVVDSRRAKDHAPWGHPGYDLEAETCIPYPA